MTPSFNQGKYIRATIESVLVQDYPNIEYVVTDGDSTDETLSILREYNGRVRWISEPDRGQAHAISKGFSMTSGEILTWLNSDDMLLPGAVSSVVAAFQQNPKLRLVYGCARELDSEGRPVGDAYSRQPDVWELIHTGDYVPQPASFFRRDGFEEVGGLDEDLHWTMDYDLFIRLSLRYETMYLPDFLAEFRLYDECKTSSGGWSRVREICRVVRRYSAHPFPATCFNYGEELIRSTLRRRLKDGYSSGLSRVAMSGISAVRRYLESCVGSRTASLHWDGWAGRVLDLFLANEGKSVIRLRGTVPPEKQLGGAQRVCIRVNGIHVRERFLPFGKFDILIPLDRSCNSDFVHLQLLAYRSFVPAHHERGDDFRRLAFRLDSADWVSATDDDGEHRVGGWHPDGWAAPYLSTIVPPETEAVEITGCVPADYPKLKGQQLTITVDGKPLASQDLEAGDFRFVIPINPGELPHEIEIAATRWFIPARENMGDDQRRLAFQLHTVTACPPERVCLRQA